MIGEGGGVLGDTSTFQVEMVAMQVTLLRLILNLHKQRITAQR